MYVRVLGNYGPLKNRDLPCDMVNITEQSFYLYFLYRWRPRAQSDIFREAELSRESRVSARCRKPMFITYSRWHWMDL